MKKMHDRHFMPISKIILRTMKLTIILVALSIVNCLASAYSQKVSLNLNNVKFSEAINEISKQTKLDFAYSKEIVDMNRKISISATNTDLRNILDRLLEGTKLMHVELNGKIYFGLKDYEEIIQSTFLQQQKNITGIVTDSITGETLPGVTVFVQGTTKATKTGVDGKYSLEVSNPNAVLLFSFIGYQTERVSISGRSIINIKLKTDIKKLDEVVVIGYGTVKRRDVTGSISSLKSSEITSTPASNALNSLQGKISGLDLTRSDGEAGAKLNFSVRGTRSLTASNEPLILVDGIPYGSTLDINASDIESMEVLKDASSTAIYGSRGANGVILITTKKGKSGKPVVSFNSYYGVQSPAGLAKIQSGDEYVKFKREAYRTQGITDDAQIFNSGELTAIQTHNYTDWMRDIIQNGLVQNNEVGVTGGNDRTVYNLSFGSYNEEGLFKNDKLKRYNGTLGLTFNLTNNIKIGANVFFTYKENNKRYDPLNQANKIMPFGKPYDSAGNVILYPVPGSSFAISPLADEVSGSYIDNIQTKRMLTSSFLEWKFLKGFTFKSTIGLDFINEREGFFYGQYTIRQNGSASNSGINTNNTSNMNWENTLNFEKNIGVHNFIVLLGNSLITSSIETQKGTGAGQVSDLNSFYNLGSNSSQIAIGSGLIETKLLSYFGRVNYKLMDKYLLTASLRADGASELAKNHKWGYFPSFAAAWIITEEPFMKDVKLISNLKLRSSWGESGNSSVSAYSTLGGLGRSVYSFNETAAYGYYPLSISNPDLKWERTAVVNCALDFALLKNRVSGTIEYYVSKTRDLLMQTTLPATSGFSSITQNVGKTQNKGIELEISTKNFQSTDLTGFNWNTTFSYSRNKEEIVELAGGETRDIANGWFIGQPISVFYDYKKIGIWQTNEAAQAAKYGQYPGDIKVQDVGNTGTITADKDRMIVGTPRPKYSFGLNNNFSYKKFDLSVFLYARVGQTISSEASGNYKINGMGNGPVVDYWTPENPTNDHPRPDKNKTSNSAYMSTLYYVDGSFLKIRDINLGYDLTSIPFLKKINVSKLRIYTSLKNFFTFSHMGPYDPEGNGSISFPMTKQIIFGLNVNF